MKLYNTLTRTVEEFTPINDKRVKIYTCGPTVYSFAHIGNFTCYVYWDLLVRTLQKRAMSGLHPYVAYGILPFFAFVAAGFSFKGLSLGQLFAPVPLGIMAGLLIGKQVGVLALSALAVGLGLARRPSGATWLDLYGAALLCGVGFTMSLFIGALAFDPRDPLIQTQVRLGVIAGSAASALAGMAVLAWSARRRPVEA